MTTIEFLQDDLESSLNRCPLELEFVKVADEKGGEFLSILMKPHPKVENRVLALAFKFDDYPEIHTFCYKLTGNIIKREIATAESASNCIYEHIADIADQLDEMQHSGANPR